MEGARPGRRGLLVALVVVAALVAALVALQLADERDDAGSSAPVHVKGASVLRASLAGRVVGAEDLRVEISVTVRGVTERTVAATDGSYRIDDLLAGLAELTWTAESRESVRTSTSDGIRIGTSRTGRAQLTLMAGENRFDLDT